jgi:hypothetical protein
MAMSRSREEAATSRPASSRSNVTPMARPAAVVISEKKLMKY